VKFHRRYWSVPFILAAVAAAVLYSIPHLW